jgi:hypothetical protein
MKKKNQNNQNLLSTTKRTKGKKKTHSNFLSTRNICYFLRYWVKLVDGIVVCPLRISSLLKKIKKKLVMSASIGKPNEQKQHGYSTTNQIDPFQTTYLCSVR